jgi:hypothetical protein
MALKDADLDAAEEITDKINELREKAIIITNIKVIEENEKAVDLTSLEI